MTEENQQPKKKRGRPKGSKSKVKTPRKKVSKKEVKQPKNQAPKEIIESQKKSQPVETVEVKDMTKLENQTPPLKDEFGIYRKDADKSEEHNICLVADMGVGDMIMITIATVYDFVFKNNPNIKKIWYLGSPQINEFFDIVKTTRFNETVNIKFYEKQYHTKYDNPMSKAGCEILNVPFDKDKCELYLSDEEIEFANDILESANGKPTIILHGYGSNVNGQGKQMVTIKDWFPEYWDKLIEMGKDKYHFIQIGGKGEHVMKGAFNLAGSISFRQSFALIKQADSFVCIDSFTQHAANALGKTGVVLFGRSNPNILGHQSNCNLIVTDACSDIMCGRPEGGFGDMHPSGEGWLQMWQCPHKNCMKALSPEIVFTYMDGVVQNYLATKAKNTGK